MLALAGDLALAMSRDSQLLSEIFSVGLKYVKWDHVNMATVDFITP